MPPAGMELVESGMAAARFRSAVLSLDAAGSRERDFAGRDVSPEIVASADGARFALAVRAVPSGPEGIERAMAATAENSIRFRALADQERAMLREYRVVVEDARR